MDQVSNKLKECQFVKKNHQKNQAELATVLDRICQEHSWELGDLMDPKVIKDAEENIAETRKHYEHDKSQKEFSLNNELDEQQQLLNKLEVEKAHLESKKAIVLQNKIQKNKELAMTKRQLSELDGFSGKLDKLQKQLKETDDQLEKVKKGTDMGSLDQSVQDKSFQVQSLDKEVKVLRQELSSLASQREVSSLVSCFYTPTFFFMFDANRFSFSIRS